jgi:hypothetical protein
MILNRHQMGMILVTTRQMHQMIRQAVFYFNEIVLLTRVVLNTTIIPNELVGGGVKIKENFEYSRLDQLPFRVILGLMPPRIPGIINQQNQP